MSLRICWRMASLAVLSVCVSLTLCSCGKAGPRIRRHMEVTGDGVKAFGFTVGDDFEKATQYLEKKYKKGPLSGGFTSPRYYNIDSTAKDATRFNDYLTLVKDENNDLIVKMYFHPRVLPGYDFKTVVKEMEEVRDRDPTKRGKSISVDDVPCYYLEKKCGWKFDEHRKYVGKTFLFEVGVGEGESQIHVSLRIAEIPKLERMLRGEEAELAREEGWFNAFDDSEKANERGRDARERIKRIREEIQACEETLAELRALDKDGKYSGK